MHQFRLASISSESFRRFRLAVFSNGFTKKRRKKKKKRNNLNENNRATSPDRLGALIKAASGIDGLQAEAEFM